MTNQIQIYQKEQSDRLWTTSINVAERFGKRHDDVLKKISNLECSQEFVLRNFAEIFYKDSYERPQPMYEISRDGFTILAMGFTGKKAMHWKETYIAAFNAMEDKLKEIAREKLTGSTAPPPPPIEDLTPLVKQYKLALQIYKSVGYSKEEAAIQANTAILNLTGHDLFSIMGIAQKLSKKQSARKKKMASNADEFLRAVYDLPPDLRGNCAKIRTGRLLIRLPLAVNILASRGIVFDRHEIASALKSHPDFLDSNYCYRCMFNADSVPKPHRVWMFYQRAIIPFPARRSE